MLVYKAYKFRMYPNDEQKSLINQTIGTVRFVYNNFLGKKIDLYKNESKTYLLSDMKKDIKNMYLKYPWIKSIDSSALRIELDHLDNSYNNFFNNGYGYPNFKKKNLSGSYSTSCIRSSYKDNSYSNIQVDLDKRIIKLPKLKEVPIKGYRNLKELPGKIINATISREAGKYYVSVLVSAEILPLPITNNIVGIDLGVKDLVITSDNIKYHSLNLIKKYEKKIKGLQRWLTRCERDSKNRYKVRLKIARVYQKMKNARKYYTDYITSKLIKENDCLISEDLKIKKMIEKGRHSLSKVHFPK